MRKDIWRRFGALGTEGHRSPDEIRKQFAGLYRHLGINGTIRAESGKDIINDIFTYRAAAMLKVRQAIHRRTKGEDERKRLFGMLKAGRWLEDKFLHRQMRHHFRHGVAKADNQFVVRSDRVATSIEDGRLVISIILAKPKNKPVESIRLVTTTNGSNVDMAGSNLRIMVEDDRVAVHYCTDKPAGRAHGDKVIGIDKGYTEAFADDEGDFYGTDFGTTIQAYSDRTKATGQARNKLYALERKHREAGRTAKADRIRKNNLGRRKLNRRKARTQAKLRTIAYKSAHKIVDKASEVVSEDLTAPIRQRDDRWRNYNRRMSAWAKGTLAQAIDEVSEQRGASHTLVNAAYTSQIDSRTSLLEGRRDGHRFYHANGDVSHAGTNAARNVKSRKDDPDITRYMPYREVRSILLARLPAGDCSVNRVQLGFGVNGQRNKIRKTA